MGKDCELVVNHVISIQSYQAHIFVLGVPLQPLIASSVLTEQPIDSLVHEQLNMKLQNEKISN